MNDDLLHSSLLELNRLIRGEGMPGESLDVAGWLLADSGTGLAALNLAFVTDSAVAAGSLAQLEAWFAGRSDGFRIILRRPDDDAVAAAAALRGYREDREQPVMASELPIATFAMPDTVHAAEVTDARAIRDYLAVRAANDSTHHGRAPDATEGEFIAAVIATGRFKYFVALVGERPVATASCAEAEGIVHVSNVWVAPDQRNRGLGAAMTALAAGAFPAAKVAALEASQMGEPVYRRMGFAERFRYTQMSRPATT